MEKRILKEMRLIDANQFEVISYRAQGDREYVNGFDDGVDYVVSKIDKAETVDAIPIEWLKKKLEQKKQQQYGQLGVASILKVLMYWEKEHEMEDSASN